MLFCHIDLIDSAFSLRRDQFVGVREGRIAYIGDTRPEGDWGDCYDGRHRLLMPGFFNTHCHAAMTLLRGAAEGLPLDRWLHEKVFPAEARLTPAAIGAGARLAIAEMLRSGTVSFTDMYFACDATGQAALESGIKCNLGRSLNRFDGDFVPGNPAYEEVNGLLRDWNGAGDGRILIDLCIHAEYTSDPALVEQVAAHAAAARTGIQVHLSETRQEHEDCKARHGKTPAAYFADRGLFDVPATAAHCVWVEPEDRKLLADHGVSVASCPASNLKLASGFADLPALLRAGVNVTLGTDGAASNNMLDGFHEMNLMALIAKGASGDPTALSPADCLRIATRCGAVAQRRVDCGSISLGHKADLCVIDTDQPWYTPAHDLVGSLVYAARGSDVVLTMVDGRVLYQDGDYKTLDIERAKYDAQRFAARLF